MLVDSHCHLDFPDFAEDLDGVIGRAKDAGVATMVTICTRMTEFSRVHAIALQYDDVWCSAGVHPHNVETEGVVPADVIVSRTLVPEVVAIGETGLDYHYDNSPREAQRESFREHIAAARETGLPVIVHSRAADEDTVDILAEEMGKGPFAGVIHCFSTTSYLSENAVKLGLYVSLAGILTFRNAEEVREATAGVPLERLLVETDSPYLAPVPNRGKTNEPAFVVHTARKLAEVKGVDEAEIATATTENFFKLFTKAERPSA